MTWSTYPQANHSVE